MSDYKVHLFQSLGNNKLHSQRMQCGRNLFRNSRGTHVVKIAEFVRLYNEEPDVCCSKCAEWAKQQGKLK